MRIVGLTGGIASGKSSVSKLLEELGVRVIDADILARIVVAPGQPAWQDIVAWLGPSILLANGEIDRRRLGEQVFADLVARQRLEQITHPRIQAKVRQALAEAAEQGVTIVVLVVPLLLESNWQGLVDAIWVVAVDPDVQVARLMDRDGLTREQAWERMNSQMSLTEKKRHADVVIDNNGRWQETREQVLTAWQYLQQTNNE